MRNYADTAPAFEESAKTLRLAVAEDKLDLRMRHAERFDDVLQKVCV